MLTRRQRAKINRQNASHAKGPTSEAGKLRSRENALKHGLSAKVLNLPAEDPAVVAEKRLSWHEAMRPEGVLEITLVDQAAHAAQTLGRCIEAVHAVVAQQVRHAEDEFDHDQQIRVAEDVALLDEPTLRTAFDLTTFLPGAVWLLNAWIEVGRAPVIDPAAVARLSGKPVHDARRDALAATVTAELAALTARIPRLEANEIADRAEAPVRARVPMNTSANRLTLRYMRSAEVTLERSLKLVERLQIERFLAQEGRPQNEPKGHEKPKSNPSKTTTCGEPKAVVHRLPSVPDDATRRPEVSRTPSEVGATPVSRVG